MKQNFICALLDTLPCNSAHRRKKQPEQVRAALIHAAARLAVEKGMAGITVQAVAQAAGVTKGGFFHHFPHKQALLDALLDGFLADNEAEMDRLIAADDCPAGRFTRAYVGVAFSDILLGADNPRVSLSLAMMSSPELCARWSAWLAERLRRHQDTDSGPKFELIRLAADGAWLARSMTNPHAVRDVQALKAHLIQLTREND